MFREPLILSLKLALITTLVLVLIGIPLAYFLSRSKSRTKPFIESIISLPLVLPPTVLGFYFLMAFGRNSELGSWLDDTLGLSLVFSFEGLVIASVIYSLPFMVHPVQAGFRNLPASLREAAQLMGHSDWSIFHRILVPNIKSSLITGIVLSFAHTIGEFGVVLMIGGNIPGLTEVASIAIYKEVETMNYAAANQYSLILLLFSFAILFMVYAFNRKSEKVYWK